MPPPSLGIRVIGVNMIHGVPDKLNIYVKKVKVFFKQWLKILQRRR